MKRARRILLLVVSLLGPCVLSSPAVAFDLKGMFGGEEQSPPSVTPFKLPSLTGEEADYHEHIPPLTPAPKINADHIFVQAVNCFPAKSLFDVEVHIEGGISNKGFAAGDSSMVGKSYAGIVARMPLYSPKNTSREREREYLRRTTTSQLIGQFVAAIATRNHAKRASALYTALEARSQVRVQKGLAETSEQVTYMEKLLGAHETLIKAEADITTSRLSIVAQCEDRKRGLLNNWLKRMAIVPEANG